MLFVLLFYFSFYFFFFCKMFVGIITENPHETSTSPLGQLRGLTACCIC
ncbi:hypothetical protein ACMBCN_03080 [Candidatus Liberibacter asiaticus]|nr:hypothetical protein [Candidatus Liberibacter asiaticus]